MAGRRSGDLFKHLSGLFRVGTLVGVPDAQLLGRFVAGRDEAGAMAFRAIVERHGPMVLRVCQSVVGDWHDAEDAFQVTFLVLARKAGSIRKQRSLSSWLHGVAHHVALRAQTAARRRLVRETKVAKGAEMAAVSSEADEDRGDLTATLHQEITRLPAKYRAPIVLCSLQGMTHDQAASELGWPVGTVRGRLARGRQLLKARLERRGVAAPSAMLTARWLTGMQAALTPSLVESTVQTAAQFAAVGKLSTSIQSLTQGVLRSMLLDKLKAISLAIVVVSASSGGVATVWAPGAHETPLASAPQAQGPISRVPGAKISEIRFEGNASIPPEKIRAKLLSKAGQPFDMRKVEADLKSLAQTKWFSDVRYFYDETPPGSKTYTLTFRVREMPVLTYVEFRGRKAVPLKDIEDTTGLKKGNLADSMRTRNPVDLIQRLYSEKGYDLASVKLIEGGNTGDTHVVIEPRFTSQPGVVDLLYHISEGEPYLLDELDIKGNDRKEDKVIRREAVQAPSAGSSATAAP